MARVVAQQIDSQRDGRSESIFASPFMQRRTWMESDRSGAMDCLNRGSGGSKVERLDLYFLCYEATTISGQGRKVASWFATI